MSYHKNGMVNAVVHSNGVIDTFGLGLAGMQRPKSITVTGMSTGPGSWTTGDISYDGAGNITAMGNDWFVYDGLSRLTQAHMEDVDNDDTDDAVDIAYRYDPFGNRTDTFWSNTEQGGLTTSWYTYSTDATTNRLSEELYDSSGNMTTLHGDSFTWYPFNQMQHRSGTGRIFYYAYTVDGERFLTKDENTDPTHIKLTVRGLDGKVVREFKLEGEDIAYTWEKDYIHANGKLLATADAGGTHHYHLDHLGTPRIITDASGNQLAFNTYSPYGIQLAGEKEERLKFTGHERDPGNLDYMHARYYSPIVSRFLSVDPAQAKAGGSQGWNRYTYALDNPMKFVDPDGEVSVGATGNATIDEFRRLNAPFIQDFGTGGLAMGFKMGGTAVRSASLLGRIKGLFKSIRGLFSRMRTTMSGKASPYAFKRTHSISGRASSKNVAAIANDLKANGWKGDPIKAYKHEGEMYVLDGHHRLEAAKIADVEVQFEIVDDLAEWGYESAEELLKHVDDVGPNRLRIR